MSYDLLLPTFAGAVCARTAGPGHTMTAAPNTNAANLIPSCSSQLSRLILPLPYLTQLTVPGQHVPRLTFLACYPLVSKYSMRLKARDVGEPALRGFTACHSPFRGATL
jgi:hypothetical protein